MIVAERKSIDQIKQYLTGYKKVLVAGCGSCVAVCFTGGEKEVGILASQIRIMAKQEAKEIEVLEQTVKRQCEYEFVDELKNLVNQVEAIVSLACGAGIQYLATRFAPHRVYPGVNTIFLGGTDSPGLWIENCQSCGDCVLDTTGGICPVTRCAKSLLNGPCGGSHNGKCEVNEDTPCAWQLIYERMSAANRIDELMQIQPVKDWSKSRDGGVRKLVRENLRI